MASYGVAQTVTYVAWDATNNAGKTGDAANHTLRWVHDGTEATPANSPAEVDATNAPGIYKITLTAAEMQTNIGTLCGKSSTTGVAIIPVTITTEILPSALDAGGYVKCDVEAVGGAALSTHGSGMLPSDVRNWVGTAPNALQSGRVDGYLGAAATGVIAAASFASGALDAVWSALLSGLTTAGSIGKKLADWALGSDNRVLVSSDLHTTGAGVQEVVNDVIGKVRGGTGSTFLGAGVQAELSSGERDGVADALLDRADGVESSLTPRQALRLVLAVLAGKAAESSGTVTFKRKDGATTALTVVHDDSGNRTTVTIGTV